MPGIFGIVANGSYQEHKETLEAMAKSTTHESFYTSGRYSNQQLGVWAGWSCQSGSFADCLPVWNEQKDICCLFSGELFPEHDEIERLKIGHQFRTSNASYLVHLYEEIGLKFVPKLNGWFSGLLIDLREGKIFLFNDRYGMDRIYFHEDETGFYFASEAKALLKVLPKTRNLEPRSFAEFLTCGCVLQNRALFSGISVLPGGSLWTFSEGRLSQKEPYFDRRSWENQPQLAPSDYYEKFKLTWKRILPRYFRAGEPSALSLTGGVDSRMMLAWLNPEPDTLPCYTWGSQYRDCWDVRLARKIAGICRQPHRTIPLDGTFLSEFPTLAEKAVHESDGTADVTGAIDMYLQPLAREIAPIRLSGGNGNESLRQKISFKPAFPKADLFAGELVPLIQAAAETYATELNDHRVSFCVFKQAPWYSRKVFALERSQLVLRTPYLDNDLVALAYQAPPECLDISFPLRLISEGNPALAEVWTDRGFNLRPAPGTRRARRLLQEFTFKAEYAYDVGMPQWLARIDHVLSPLHLEKVFLGRHKTYHFRVWFRDELADYVKEILLDSRSLQRPYLRRRQVENTIKEHVNGSGNHTDEIIRLLTVELMQKKLLESA
jgi:asparagine synthase (glutamine-hydrolysing)